MTAAHRTIIRRIGAADGFDNATTYPNSDLDLWIADALLFVPTAKLGDKADLAVAYYTCHLMLQATSTVSSTGGTVTSKKAGDIQISYGSGGASNSSSLHDKYWTLYQSILKGVCRNSPMILGHTP